MRIGIAALLCVSMLGLAACGTGQDEDYVSFKREKFEFSQEQPILEYGIEHAQPAPEIDVPLDGVPGLDELPAVERNASNAPEDFVRYGAQIADPALKSFATVNGDFLIMTPDWVRTADPPTSDLAWAVYGFNLTGYAEPGTLQLWWDGAVPAAGNYFIGLSDFSSSRWLWFQGPAADSAMDFGSLEDYFSASNDLYIAVVLTGTGSFSLGQLRIGSNLSPVSSFTPDVSSGTVPLTVNFDASASYDLDGDIVSYEWDMTGSGSFSAPITEDSTSFEFSQAGNFLVRLQVTDNEGGTNIAESVITVNDVSSNEPPTAVIGASATSGDAPLAVTFNGTASSDPDGTIEKYEWDLDGDGSFETDTGNVDNVPTVFNDPGNYDVKLRVTDDMGSTDTDNILIEVSEVSAGSPPVAVLQVDNWFKTDEGGFTFDASDSTDPDNDIVKYEFDWDSNGSYELDNGSNPEASTPLAEGSHLVTVRVTDSGDRTDTASVTVVQGNPSDYHETEANDDSSTADSLGGYGSYALGLLGWRGNLGEGGYDGSEEDWYEISVDGPKHIGMDILFIDAEADIDVQLFHESDLDNAVDSSTSTSDNERIDYDVPAPGTYFLRVYIFSGAGDRGPADYTINGSISGSPVCVVEANPLSGSAPLTVNFDASGSYHPDGFAIVKYELDAEGNGGFINHNGNSSFQYTYYTSGPINPVVRVTDENGSSATATVQINPTVTLDEVEDNDSYDTGNSLPGTDFTGWFGNLGPGGVMDGDETDWYKIVVGSAGTYRIDFYFIDDLADLDMKLYDTDGSTERGSSTSTTDNESITYNFPVPGTYYLHCYVWSSSSSKIPQDYMLEIGPDS